MRQIINYRLVRPTKYAVNKRTQQLPLSRNQATKIKFMCGVREANHRQNVRQFRFIPYFLSGQETIKSAGTTTAELPEQISRGAMFALVGDGVCTRSPSHQLYTGSSQPRDKLFLSPSHAMERKAHYSRPEIPEKREVWLQHNTDKNLCRNKDGRPLVED